MPGLADSDAFFDPDRMLPQHQAVATMLQGMVSDPDLPELRWLDLGSGRGQIIAHLKNNLTGRQRAKIAYFGYDIDNGHTRQAQKIAESLGLSRCGFGIGELARFARHEGTNGPWSLITLTNTVHEIDPESLSRILISALERMNENGLLFIYDMNRLPKLELGAVLWTGSEFQEVLTTLSRSLGAVDYEPPVGTWPHRSCDGWNAQIRLAHMRLPQDWRSRTSEAVRSTSECIRTIVKRKLAGTRDVLEAFTKHGPETAEEQNDKERLLYDFWALTRAMGGSK